MSVTEQGVRETAQALIDPETGRPFSAHRSIRSVKVEGGAVGEFVPCRPVRQARECAGEIGALAGHQVQQAADRLCGGKLVMVHEGGYAESYVPFCGLAVMEALSGIRTEVQDPLREFIQQQQPRAEFAQFQRQALDRLAQQFGLL